MSVQIDQARIICAAANAAGEETFVTPSEPARHTVPGVVDVAYFWEMAGSPSLAENIGKVPSDLSFPSPGGAKFALVTFPAHSAGKFDATSAPVSGTLHDADLPQDMHRSASIDVEVIISGKIDLVLANGETRTLSAGDCLIMGGAMHAWRNIYDEPCTYVAMMIGAYIKE